MDPDRIPPLVKDFYWDKQNCPIPYTEASMHFKRKTYKGSADDMMMTISYQRDVASSTAGGFTRLLFKWKGSLYKLIYRELLLFQTAYILLSLIYRQLLSKNQRSLFEMVVKYFDAFLNLIPLSFVLGFYVSYVVTLATYLFFIFTVIGRQKIDTLKKGEYMRSGRMPMDIDLYIPIYTILQFFFFMGLLKVAEQLINPFGDDDEDFELNWLVDRHMKASFLGCDILMDPDRIPPLVKDFYWDKQNCPIPYTEASMHFKRKTYKGSADDMISTAGGFTRLLFKWKGSLYKLIYRELLLFQTAYILLSLIYRQLLSKTQRRLFHSVACFVGGFDEDSRMLRRSLMRYMNLALILVLRSISSAVKQRFPTLEHVVEAGFMTYQEKELFSAVPSNEFNTYWIPCTWFIYRLQEASLKGKLVTAFALETIMKEFCEFRAKCGLLWCYDWVSIPMVYTQVVTLATYVFFIFTVIGRQKIDTLKKGEYMRSGRMPMDIDLYIPIFTILQFFFYMGLLKVAEQLINPFGDDDEDFELNWLVDRHMKASFLGCDILMDPDRIPPMVKDYYWDKQNCPIPYTEASMHFKRKTYKGSADDMM
eukprot:maker-scaffold18_size714446-snap-gene-3.23 protein:Tk08469 transcript:maker-scaffold18_size714446-snap-gene-3.23-mRNA-1 annotation:"PREDICTED: bestrophin-4-like"